MHGSRNAENWGISSAACRFLEVREDEKHEAKVCKLLFFYLREKHKTNQAAPQFSIWLKISREKRDKKKDKWLLLVTLCSLLIHLRGAENWRIQRATCEFLEVRVEEKHEAKVCRLLLFFLGEKHETNKPSQVSIWLTHKITCLLALSRYKNFRLTLTYFAVSCFQLLFLWQGRRLNFFLHDWTNYVRTGLKRVSCLRVHV